MDLNTLNILKIKKKAKIPLKHWLIDSDRTIKEIFKTDNIDYKNFILYTVIILIIY